MSEKNMEKMKAFLEKKKADNQQKQQFQVNKKIGSAATSKKNQKTRGSNNKV
ncbi:hypothetical protein [Fusibacter ferrireducens]|uniref:DUF4023 domain-containing protein n=1 Tax=Fusibacter ferrireducens TaxID=2785058 RepID=A0ABR9ZZE1_9FIRM|nr:hypothetical protein [Fusibacter ferrireducens]MBF4695265.1 hypothetical protein [Fusibacter ferrireducens]